MYKPMKRVPKENKVREKILEELRKKGHLHIPLVQGEGLPDLLVLPKRTTWSTPEPYFIEIKRPGGKTRPNQDGMIAELRRNGYEVKVRDSSG